jgi:uncharacterized protein (TIGR02246 family)
MSINEEVIRGALDAYNARDLDKLANCLAPNAVFLDGLGNKTIEGRENIRQIEGRAFDRSPKLHVEIITRMVIGNYVVTEEHVTGINLEGYPTEARLVVVYRVEDGKITRAQSFNTET